MTNYGLLMEEKEEEFKCAFYLQHSDIFLLSRSRVFNAVLPSIYIVLPSPLYFPEWKMGGKAGGFSTTVCKVFLDEASFICAQAGGFMSHFLSGVCDCQPPDGGHKKGGRRGGTRLSATRDKPTA